MKSIAIMIVSLWISGCASSATNIKTDISNDDKSRADRFMQTAQAFVQSAVGANGNVQVFIKGDEATLTGYVDSIATRQKVARAALKDKRVNSVNNRIIAN